MKTKLITIILSTMLIVVPLAIMPSGAAYNLPKIYALLIIGGLLLVLMFINYKKLILDKKDYIIIAFAIIILISTLLSSNIRTSIFGNKNRFEGMLSLYSYIIIYFCAKKFLKYKNNKTLLLILQAVYIIVSILGIAQQYVTITTDELYPIFKKGVCGTFGNTNFMGSFISMGIPIFIITYILKGNKISFITSLLVFWSLIACHARSGWVAFIIFCLMLLIYLIKNRKKEYVIRTGILIICFCVIFAVLYYAENSVVKSRVNSIKKDIKIIQNEIKKEQITENNEAQQDENKQVSDIEEKVGSGRIQVWKITIELIQKYPILGVGPDNLGNAVIENLTDTSIDFIIRMHARPDKAHNEYLQIAVTLGVPALVLYLIFICLIVLPKTKQIFINEQTFIINSVIISYLAQAFFNISTIGVAPLFWFALGFADNSNK